MALSDALGKPKPLVYLSDSEALASHAVRWQTGPRILAEESSLFG